MNPLFITPAAAARGLADLAMLASSAKDIAALARAVDPERLNRALDDLAIVAGAADRLPEIQDDVVDRVGGLETQLAGLLSLAGRLEGGLPAIGDVLDRIGTLDGQLTAVSTLVGALEQDIKSIGEIAPSVDTLTIAARTLADAVEPLQGLADRAGRIADRLPGSRAAAVARSVTPKPKRES
jgi:hypothetical protein